MKDGVRTSEYWLILLATLIAAATPLIPLGTTWEKIAASALAVLAALGYTAARTRLKADA